MLLPIMGCGKPSKVSPVRCFSFFSPCKSDTNEFLGFSTPVSQLMQFVNALSPPFRSFARIDRETDRYPLDDPDRIMRSL